MSNILPIVDDCCRECCSGSSITCDTIAIAQAVVIDTLALLRLATYWDHKSIWLLGEITPGDGQDGAYWFDAASMAVDAPMTIVRPTALTAADPGRWIRI